MDIRLDRLHSTFVVEVKSFDIATPMDDATRDTIITAMDEHAICVFRSRVPVADEVHLAFGRAFGPLMRQKMQQTVSGRGIRLTSWSMSEI